MTRTAVSDLDARDWAKHHLPCLRKCLMGKPMSVQRLVWTCHFPTYDPAQASQVLIAFVRRVVTDGPRFVSGPIGVVTKFVHKARSFHLEESNHRHKGPVRWKIMQTVQRWRPSLGFCFFKKRFYARVQKKTHLSRVQVEVILVLNLIASQIKRWCSMHG